MDCLFWKEMVGLMLAVLTSTGEGRAKIGLKEQQFNAFEGTNASPVFYHASLQLVPVWVPKICVWVLEALPFLHHQKQRTTKFTQLSVQRKTRCLC